MPMNYKYFWFVFLKYVLKNQISVQIKWIAFISHKVCVNLNLNVSIQIWHGW